MEIYSEFSHEKWTCSIVMLVFQGVFKFEKHFGSPIAKHQQLRLGPMRTPARVAEAGLPVLDAASRRLDSVGFNRADEF